MSGTVSYIVESTILAIVIYWIITHSLEFSKIAQASQQAVVGSVQALWGAGDKKGG